MQKIIKIIYQFRNTFYILTNTKEIYTYKIKHPIYVYIYDPV